MKRYVEQKAEAWQAHAAQFECAHEQTALRRRTIRGGGVQYVHQCARCGESTNQPVAKARALKMSGGVEPPAFDDELRESWVRHRDESAAKINARFNRDAFFADYDEYLQSQAWAKRRAHVLMRAQGSCEGCGEAPPTEVHHLSYAHVGDEFLFELVALCQACHGRMHAEEQKLAG